MKNLFTNKLLLKIGAVALFTMPFSAIAQKQAADAKMNTFISTLMKKMTTDEKIGQLNLVTGGMAITGSVTNNGIDNNIRRGNIGGIFGLYGTANVRKAQDEAVKTPACISP